MDRAVLVGHLAERLVVDVLKPGHWIFGKRLSRNTVAKELAESHPYPIITQQSRSYARTRGRYRDTGASGRAARRDAGGPLWTGWSYLTVVPDLRVACAGTTFVTRCGSDRVRIQLSITGLDSHEEIRA